MKPYLSLPALAVTATCLMLQVVSAAALPADVLFSEDFENPDVPSYLQGITPDIWVPAAAGFGAVDHGMTDKSGGDFSAPSGNEQAYAFRYTNSGLTTKEKALGSPLIFGGGYEISFDVVKDNSNAGRAYSVKLIAFGAGAARNDCRSTPSGSTQLASTTGNAPADGSITTVTLTFIPSATTHATEFGKDLGIRFTGSTSSAIIDNIKFRAIPGTGSTLNLVTTSPLDNSVNNLATSPVKAIFSKNISAGAGNITLRNLTDTTDTVIPVSDPRLAINGTCLDILPGPYLTWGKDYAVLIDAGAVIENPGGAPFTGITDPTVWNFTTAGGDPLLFSISRLKQHITGVITLTPSEIDTIKRNLDSVAGRFAESATSITALLDLVSTYDTGTITGRKGPLWVATVLPRRNVVTNDLHWTMFTVMQNIMDRIYTGQTLAAHESLLNGFKYGSSSNFPGVCAAPAPNTRTAAISASYLKTYGPSTIQDGPGNYARKPTGSYLAPGTIATVTVPASMIGTGYKIRVGCHSWDFSAKPDIRRLDRVTRVYDIISASTKIASPLGGGIYIEVPWLANAGVVNLDISGAVRSPYFSAKSFHSTTSTQWETVERTNPAPWADFQTDKFMMQVPKSWVSSMTGAQAIQLMADWDASMDAVNDLMGYTAFNPATGPAKYIRGKETMYPQVDLLLKNSVFAPGYPSVNTAYSPNVTYDGYINSHLVRGPQNAPDWEFHELGHGYLFPKFGGESESAVNLLHVAVWNRKFGKSMDEAFRKSRGSNNTFQTLNTTAMAWMCVFSFSPYEVPMGDGEKAYQLKGHAKFVDIANLYGWDVLGKFWGNMVDLDDTNTPYPTDTDSMLLRLCKAVGKDIRPLFHFWGIHPENPSALAAAIAAANPPLPADPAIRTRLLYYKSIVPANNAAFRSFCMSWWGRQPTVAGYWEETDHAMQWDSNLDADGTNNPNVRPNGSIYVEASATQIQDRVQELVDLYFPGAITPNTMTFSVAPSAVNATTVGMTATTATAAIGPIEYYFENITNSTNSGWITSSTWNQTGLTTGTPYSFRVKARDALPIETLWSATLSATPGADITPPSPGTMNFSTPPTALNETLITMSAATASDVNGVEYFFDCTTPGGHDSAWQDSPTYTDSGLSPSTEYTYRVQARDKSVAQNATAFSASASAITPTPDLTSPSVLSLSPTDNSTDVPLGNNLVITFNELIGPNTGFITIKNLSDSTETAIDINDGAQITISGADLSIDPTTNLVPGKNYAIQIGATVLQDLAGNPFAGITDDTTWNFTSAVVPFVWTQTLGNAQDWTTGTNWLGGNAPNLIAGDTVDFSQANIAANTTLTLGADRTAQLWKFGDATTVGHDWIVNATNKMILAGTTPTIQVVNRTTTLNNVVDGTAGLVKTGGGALTLGNTANTYTGGTTIDGGNLTIAGNGSLGSGTITINASTSISCGAGSTTYNRGIALNNNSVATLSLTSNNGTATIAGAVTGTGGITLSAPRGLKLDSIANDFTGPIVMGSGIFYGSVEVDSLADSTTPGAGKITLGSTTGYGAGSFIWGAGAASALALTNRQFDIASPSGLATIQNDNATAANTVTVNSDLLSSPAGNKILVLGGANTGNNLIAGKIVNGGGTVSLTKTGAGTWIVSGANTFTGATKVGQGILRASTLKNYGADSALGAPASGTIQLGDGNTSGTLVYTGTGDTTNRNFQLGNNTAANTGGSTLNNNGSGALSFTATDFNTAIASITATRTLTLGGSYSSGSNQIQGVIRDNVASTGKVNLTKANDASSWILGAANTYTGTTTVSGGKLFINGDQTTANGNTSVAANATLGGTGTLGGDTTIASTGRLEFNLSTNASSHDKLELAAGKAMTFVGASSLIITSSGSVPPGDYTLVTAPGGFGTSVPPATFTLPATWTANAPRFVGNDLKINITFTGVVTDPYTTWAVGGGAFDADTNGDGVKNGMAWLLGAANPSENALNKLPAATRNGANLRLTFRCLKSTKRGSAQLKVQSSNDLGIADPWTNHEAAVPDADSTVNGVIFDTTDDGDYINVIADIPAAGAKTFARLVAVAP